MKKKKKNKVNINQQSFYFEDYLSTNEKFKKNKNLGINEDRIYLLFFCFFSLIFIFSIKMIFISIQNSNYKGLKSFSSSFKSLRNDIVDRNNILLSRNVVAYHAAVKPNLIKDKKKFLVKVKLLFPEIKSEDLLKKLREKTTPSKTRYFKFSI